QKTKWPGVLLTVLLLVAALTVAFFLFRTLANRGTAPGSVAGVAPAVRPDDRSPEPLPGKPPAEEAKPPQPLEKPESSEIGKLDPTEPIRKESNWFVCYPAPDQVRVPLVFPGNETPDPLPDTQDKNAGYPVTLTFAPRTSVRQVKAELREGEILVVPAWFS